MFAYPNNFWTDAVQRDVVATCFAFGRIYGSAPNDRATTGPPWFQRTVSVNGGNCNVTTLPCYTFTAPRRYTSPVSLGDRIARLGPDQWFVVQHYRFVTGRVAGRWDCRAADWRRHWTGSAEEYCWNDYRSILDRIPSTTSSPTRRPWRWPGGAPTTDAFTSSGWWPTASGDLGWPAPTCGPAERGVT
jgi:hypothetical protein